MQRINYSIPNELIIFNIQAILKSIDQLLYNLYLNIYNYTQYSMRRVIILIKVHLLIIFKRFKKTKKKKYIKISTWTINGVYFFFDKTEYKNSYNE